MSAEQWHPNLVWRWKTWVRNRFWEQAWDYRKALDDAAAWHQIKHETRLAKLVSPWMQDIYRKKYLS